MLTHLVEWQMSLVYINIYYLHACISFFSCGGLARSQSEWFKKGNPATFNIKANERRKNHVHKLVKVIILCPRYTTTMISIATCSGVEYIECKLVVGNCNGTWTVWWCNFSAFNTKPPLYRLHHSLCCIMKNTDFEHRIEINQKSDSRENLSPFLQCACPEIHHRYAILTPSWQVPPPPPPRGDLPGWHIDGNDEMCEVTRMRTTSKVLTFSRDFWLPSPHCLALLHVG